jgi:hypothetical protein
MAIRGGGVAKRMGAEVRREGADGKPIRAVAILEGNGAESRGDSGGVLRAPQAGFRASSVIFAR